MRTPHFLTFAALAVLALPAAAQRTPSAAAGRTAFEESLVEISRVCPRVVVELRYAGSRNITGKPIYPEGARALVRAGVAQRLNRAQAFLQDRGFCLKVWDAYRPASVQRLLWEAIRNPAYVVEPSRTGSLHGWGAAVDVTLVDFRGREVRMPTDFDAFSPDARYDYTGNDPEVAFNLSTLKSAMDLAGFRHIRDEWWHYSVGNNTGYGPIEVPLTPAKPASKAERREAPKSSARRVATESRAPKKTPKEEPRIGRLLFPPRTSETL